MNHNSVFWRYQRGWCYSLNGAVREGFGTAKAAGIAMRRESFYLRSVRRAESREPLTFQDSRAEGCYGTWR